MDASRNPWGPLAILLITPACGMAEDLAGEGFDEAGESETSGPTGSSDEFDTATDAGTDSNEGTDTSDLLCMLDCGAGICIDVDGMEYCECPEETEWTEFGCAPCPVVDPAEHVLTLPMVSFDGRFLLAGAAPPKLEYDDANLWLENRHTQDRVRLGNTHDEFFSVRVTPGIYDVVYELETPGDLLPRNPRVTLSRVALFGSQKTQDIDIPVATLSGLITLDGVAPPELEYDDANILFRDTTRGDEVLVGNTHEGDYSINLVPGTYDVVYRVDTAGPITPRNDGAVLMTVAMRGGVQDQPIAISSVPLSGDFFINAAPAPNSEYDDANIDLESALLGTVQLGNTHAGTYTLRVIPGSYNVVYRHETGSNVPQNHRAQFDTLLADGSLADIDVPMVELSGALTINGAAPPVSEFDDGLLHLRGTGPNAADSVPLGNTHAGSYQVRLIPGSYDAYYGQETSGGTVPDNKHASVLALVAMASANTVDIDITAVAISGTFTLDSVTPPTSEYDNGRIYLRNTLTDDAVLLGSTHEGSYSAIVVPGDYEIFYQQETGGALVPSNLNASLGGVVIAGPMNLDLDLPVVALAGQVLLDEGPAPMSAMDGGQLYLRTLEGDSVLLGDSFAPSYAVKLVAGTYGVYYRSEASLTTPQNENGRFACITVE